VTEAGEEATRRAQTQRAGDLDPEDWESFRALGHAVLDDLVDYLRTIRERPVWQSPPPATRALLSEPLPRSGSDLGRVYESVRQHILPYPTGNLHPRFWGWVMGNGTAVGVLADLVASAMNCHVSGYDQAASLVEKQVLAWLAELMDLPRDASGLLVSGGTTANLIGVTVARNRATAQRVRRDGLAGAGEPPMTIYGSTATHGWAQRSCDLLGLGEQGFRPVATDSRHRVRVDEMAREIRADRERGLHPIAIVGNAGTVACGATDDLHALADLAAAERLWFHVDGAFGALAKLSPKYRGIVDGLERADSLAFDLHKWGYIQYEVGVVLVRDGQAHADSFSFAPSYLETFRGGIAVEPTEFASRGLQLSRGFRALKVWMHLKAYGSERLGRIIEQNIEDVAYLRTLIAREPELEMLGPSEMNVVCFRFVAPGLDALELDRLNTELIVQIQESGLAVPSNARIDGRFAIRVANTNHRTQPADFDLLIESVVRRGRDLVARRPQRAT
jgi:glutamate/tyrosine decarboxylase-like PLP-dependent enzyme